MPEINMNAMAHLFILCIDLQRLLAKRTAVADFKLCWVIGLQDVQFDKPNSR